MRYAAKVFGSWQRGICCALAWFGVAAGHARAAGQDEWQAGGYALGAHASGFGPAWGAGGGVDLQYGLTDAWGLRGAAEGAWMAPDGGAAALLQTTAGVVYTWDVLRLLPLVEAGLSGATLRAKTGSQTNLGVQVGLGADYLLNRHWSMGLIGRFGYLPLALSGDKALRVGTVALRLSYRFD